MEVKTRKITVAELSGIKDADLINAKRQLRQPLMKAFDIYKSNVYYGVITETTEEHTTVMAWYNDLCDLKEIALKNIPEKVKKYL